MVAQGVLTISTQPCGSLIRDNEPTNDALSKGSVIAEDDIWIGTRAVIMGRSNIDEAAG
jgi:acetyltransferase-like isoleucine patch superfamily enzyme